MCVSLFLFCLGSRPTQAQELFTLVSRLFGKISHCLSIRPFQLLPSRNIWRRISLTWPFLHRHQRVDGPLTLWNCFTGFAVEYWFGCRGHWAWLCRRYWCYRNLSDWLIDWWMTPAILASKRYRRYLERVWRRNPTALNRSRLTRQTHLCNRQMSKAKSAHYSQIITEHSGDYGSLWKAFNKFLHRCPKIYLPDHSSIATLANAFSSFFINKISVIRSSAVFIAKTTP